MFCENTPENENSVNPTKLLKLSYHASYAIRVSFVMLVANSNILSRLACVAGRRKERRSVGREGGGTAFKDAIVFFVFFVHQMNVKILIGQIL